MTTIHCLRTRDVRFKLQPGEGADAVHTNPTYAYAVAILEGNDGHSGIGLAFTLGGGNDLVCSTIERLCEPIIGREIDELMAEFGSVFRSIADHHQYRWLGPHKGVVHLALAALTNACFDLWAKSRGVPLWKLLLDLTPQQILALLDLSYVEDVLSPSDVILIFEDNIESRRNREAVLQTGYPGYDTSIGWFHYSDDDIRRKAREAVAEGFTAMKLKVGSRESDRDIRRAMLIRETVGPEPRIMLDANQQWTLPQALRIGLQLAEMSPYWIEEPTHPDDVLAHQTLARALSPVPIALGEHVPHRISFKNLMQAGAMQFVQADCVRVGGISEFLTIGLMARKFGLKLVPHVGDMGQIHQHLVLFNHIAMNHEIVFLEYIPHLRRHFTHPAKVSHGVYHTPQEPGCSADLIL